MSLFARFPDSEIRLVDDHLRRGMAAWGVREAVDLETWARKNFYLSAESSYVEQAWVPWAFQSGILALMSDDAVEAVSLKKSARVGYTKMLLAAICYNAEHRRRNQCVWRPTESDAGKFTKTDLDTALRDVQVMRTVFPTYLSRHKDNTLEQKKFIGSILHIRGGTAAKNYRDLSVDVALVDELSAFDNDVEGEGAPDSLAAKRLEGATYPKFICGSTPKIKGFCLIDARYAAADERFTFQIRCPQCAGRHALTWGGKDEPHGFKFDPKDPDGVRHLCPHCAYPLTQAEYLSAADTGEWVNERGDVFWRNTGEGGWRFTTEDGIPVPAPRHVGVHVWTAYSPNVSWGQIVREFLEAYAKLQEGDDAKMKAWVNTTRGEAWEGEVERTDVDDLKNRAEPFALRHMPRDCLLLLCGVDTQDNRLEGGVWGLGRGGRMWTIDHRVFFGNPAQQEIWDELEDFLRTQEYTHASGIPQKIYATAIDSGGHHADAVYAFAHRLKVLRVHAIKGVSGEERSIDNGNTKVSYKWNGKIERHGPVLWHVGTNLAKDRFQSRLEVTKPGPGYVHLSNELTDEWYKQLAGEIRATRKMRGGTETRWTAARKRIEVKDCLAYAIWLEERLDLWAPRRAKWWDQLEQLLQSEDLFSMAPAAARQEVPATPRVAPAALLQTRPPAPRRGGVVDGDWSIR